tara:strand:+ start:1755 stop:1985 length:231 start_codon:yes stop_codon:yes gene_type:complete
MLFDSPLNVINSIVKKYTGDTNSKLIRMENTIATLVVKVDTICGSLHRLTVLVNQLAEGKQNDKHNSDDAVIVFDD